MGLYREHRQNNVAKGRTLPAVLQKPPDAHAPLDFPPITLVSIDIHLEYNYPPQSEEKFCDLLAYNIDSITEFGQWHYPPKIEAFEVATLTVSAHVPGSAYSDHRPYDLTASSPVHLMQDTEDNISSSRTFLELLDLGLQRLITSANSRRPQIRTIGKDTLQSLSRLFPAIFNPGYCEVSLNSPRLRELGN